MTVPRLLWSKEAELALCAAGTQRWYAVKNAHYAGFVVAIFLTAQLVMFGRCEQTALR